MRFTPGNVREASLLAKLVLSAGLFVIALGDIALCVWAFNLSGGVGLAVLFVVVPILTGVAWLALTLLAQAVTGDDPP